MRSLCFLWLLALMAGRGWPQDAGRPQFEVASIRAHPPSGANERSGIEEDQGLIHIENLPLSAIIQLADGVKDYQLSGPDWMSASRFDIVARPPAGYRRDQLRPLLRNLLVDRFKLTEHRSSRRMSGYALSVTKSGAKLRESTGPRTFFTARPGLISGTRVSMSELVNALANLLASPIVERTGLTAVYDVKLVWTPDQVLLGPADRSNAVEAGTGIFTALSEQLGLRLQAEKTRVEVVIVDRISRTPTEN